MSKKVGFSSNARNVIIQTEKGGSRKTSTATILADIALSLGSEIALFEIDHRSELAALFPGNATHIVMPETEAVQEDDHAEIRALSPVLSALTTPGDKLVVVDIGANIDSRVAVILAKTGVDELSASADRSTTVVLPFYPEASSIQSAASSAKRAAIALPSAKILFCLCEIGGGTSLEMVKSMPGWHDTIEPHITKSGLMRLPRITPSALACYKASKVSPLAFVGLSDEALMRWSDGDPFIAGANRAAIQMFIAKAAKEFSTHLDFRTV